MYGQERQNSSTGEVLAEHLNGRVPLRLTNHLIALLEVVSLESLPGQTAERQEVREVREAREVREVREVWEVNGVTYLPRRK